MDRISHPQRQIRRAPWPIVIASHVERITTVTGACIWWSMPIVGGFVHGGVDLAAVMIAAGVGLVWSGRRYLERIRKDAQHEGFRAGRIAGAFEEAVLLRREMPSHSDDEAPR